MAQEILVAPRGLGGCERVGMRLLRRSPCRPRGCHRGRLLLKAGKGIERRTVGAHVEQTVLIHLALDLDQRIAQPAQQRDRSRLIVDEGAAAAVDGDRAPQGQQVLAIKSLLGEDGACGMIARQVERGGD